MKFFNFILLFIFSICSIQGYETRNVEIDGLQRKFLVHVPVGVPKGAPLVIFLHPYGGNALSASQHFGWVEKADAGQFVAIFPEALPRDLAQMADVKNNPNVWEDGSGRRKTSVDDIAFLKAVIEEAKQNGVDPKKIYITGFSNGGSMALRAGTALSELISAVASVEGPLMVNEFKLNKPISALLLAGDKDPLHPLDGGNNQPPMFNSIKAWLPQLGLAESNKKIGVIKGAKEFIYGPDKQGLEAIFVVVSNQGHEWPGGPRRLPERVTGPDASSLNATDYIWNFFKTQKPR